MRKLTIKRTKTIVASLMKAQIYIEDPVNQELTINDVPCRKLGTLKNGEEKEFYIDEQPLKVFAIVDKITKDNCNDVYQIPAGNEDVSITGKHIFDVSGGNPFRFDNNVLTEEMAKNRKQAKNRGIITTIVGAVVGVLIYTLLLRPILFPDGAQTPKTFSYDGMSITLTEEFGKAQTGDKYDVAYGSKAVAVFVIKEEFTLEEGFGDLTLEEYADIIMQGVELEGVTPEIKNGRAHFKYDYLNPTTNETYWYFTYLYKTDDAFWAVQLATEEENLDEYSEKITQWAETVTFS
ncbi:MAG: hypothetical protein IKB86_00750 [Clostridia bacterium]|nr:hypothetical protein [Clostridia bacterium]